MNSPDAGDGLIERLIREGIGSTWRVGGDATWLMVIPEGQPWERQGWKLHISSRATAFPGLVQAILPVLAAEGCTFKLARSQRVLAGLNDGITAPASVGKAVTVYPDQRRVRGLGLELANLLSGRPGPRVLSDRQVTRTAPVYYRYGPFAADWESGPHGRLMLTLNGPDGERVDGAAGLGYRQPPWAVDPFTGKVGDDEPPGEAEVIGGHFQITGGLLQAAGGNVYTAMDLRDGTAVVIKQARALVAEDVHDADTRIRLRNERRVLQALEGVTGIPRFVDHFRYADDEFLVTTDCGPVSLAKDVPFHGTYRTDDTTGPRSLGLLATQLAVIISQVHSRGVIIRDLSPKNVVIDGSGPSIVDLGIAAYDGLHLDGATPGYAPGRQQRCEPPVPADDYFALGMTMLFAATGLDPVHAGDDLDLPRFRALQTIRSGYGSSPPAIIDTAAGLISGTEPIAAQAFGRLMPGQPGPGSVSTRPLPAIPMLTPQITSDVAGGLLEDLLGQAEQLLDGPPSWRAAYDASIYDGSSGIGLELLYHTGAGRTGRVLEGLAGFSMRAAQQAKLPPGLFTGSTGVSIFLHEAAARGIAVPDSTGSLRVTQAAEGDDLITGTAGVGLGHLWLYRSGDPTHLDNALRCARDMIAGTAPAFPFLDGTAPGAGLDPAAGRAHGLAGTAEFLLTLASRTGDDLILAAAAERARQLADRTQALLQQTTQLAAPPLAVSWCRGLSGIAPVLLLASTVLQDPSLARLARDTAETCIAYLPRLSTPGRCCGIAGVGSVLIDLAVSTQDERYWHAAERAGVQILLRSAGTPSHLILPASPGHSSTGWAGGLAGLLSFFRRLARRGEPDSIPLPTAIPPRPLHWQPIRTPSRRG
jgi:tRNA A-37 threonylcarbamoyl transferase component Bud32